MFNINLGMEQVFISGGAGFIGSNVAKHYLTKGYNVIVYDNLSRAGTEKNLEWLKKVGGKFKFVKGDIRDFKFLLNSVKKPNIIYHLAAQVAVTTSIKDPRTDFEINALGTFNMLEACRLKCPNAVFIYSSTNKVYGDLNEYRCGELKTRYKFTSSKLSRGIAENQNLDFHSPYGCSKGTGDQYVKDYSRIYGIKSIVFRQSCIYGERQFGNEDQGWVMHFIKEILKKNDLKIFGDGKQVRDILYIDDLISAYDLAIKKNRISKGKVYNIGGGIENSYSLLELIDYLRKKLSIKIKYKLEDWRAGDQKIFISDNSRIYKDLGWKPMINKKDGVNRLITWANSIK